MLIQGHVSSLHSKEKERKDGKLIGAIGYTSTLCTQDHIDVNTPDTPNPAQVITMKHERTP
jgi:hypothetical protein